MKRYACVHGHFYQPPRENPWTGAVERQSSAGRDHDWNARIARECYIPNGEARVVDGGGLLTDVVDNYAWISFNFGPTLLSWLEQAEPAAYERLLSSDRTSARRLDGHGNALAQAYHHAILPLCSPRDRATEIRWGLADFRARFGREAEGLWLPECAADDATLAAVAADGVKFVILEPHQADSVRPLEGGAWKPAADALKPGVPYRWSGEGRALAVYFYDGPLSRSVAFERSMSDSRAFAARVAGRVPEGGAALLATDGESYGHHEAFAEMGLAHFLRYALPEAGVEPVNLAWHLSRNPPKAEVRLRAGGTSWSCAHGVERWRSACGCGEVGGGSLAWRAPLRAALEGLRDRLAAESERAAAGLIPDLWGARDAYVSVVLDRSETNVSAFLSKWAPGARDEAARVKARTILELQRHALMMFTSCGWFFDALDRLEPTQVLLYAARAIELARALGAGEDLERDFVSALADPSDVWNRRVKPQIVTSDHVAAHYAVSLLFDDVAPARVHHHLVEDGKFTRRVEGGVTVAAGRAAFVDGATGARWSRTFFAAVLKGQRVQTYVSGEELSPEDFERLIQAAAGAGDPGPLPQGRTFLLRDLRPDEREKVLTAVLKRRLARWEAAGRDQLEDALTLAEDFRGLGLPMPPGLDEETALSLAHALADAARRFADDSFGALDELKSVCARAAAAGVTLAAARAEEPFARGIERLLAGLENGSADESAAELVEAAEAARAAGLCAWRPGAQVRVFQWLKGRRSAPASAARLAELLLLKP